MEVKGVTFSLTYKNPILQMNIEKNRSETDEEMM